MGSLTYGSAPAIEIDDRLLRHLQAVIISKLRRDEPFAFNWDRQGRNGDGGAAAHGTIWISRASQLYFAYDGPRGTEPMNRQWLEQLMVAASSGHGLDPLPEPERPGRVDGAGAARSA